MVSARFLRWEYCSYGFTSRDNPVGNPFSLHTGFHFMYTISTVALIHNSDIIFSSLSFHSATWTGNKNNQFVHRLLIK